ncbi:MAG TPA: DinB family protein [Puia sp.]|nr:DinB family protein [Puia sp.]
MKEIADQLKTVLDKFIPLLEAIPEETLLRKPGPKKWSKKEIIGHLVDSALCNIRRFVVAQYEDAPYIIYEQDRSVAIAGYQDYEIGNLVQLWVLLNRHIGVILSKADDAASHRICRTNNEVPHTLQWIAKDYIRHLFHHLHQVCDLDPVAYT